MRLFLLLCAANASLFSKNVSDPYYRTLPNLHDLYGKPLTDCEYAKQVLQTELRLRLEFQRFFSAVEEDIELDAKEIPSCRYEELFKACGEFEKYRDISMRAKTYSKSQYDSFTKEYKRIKGGSNPEQEDLLEYYGVDAIHDAQTFKQNAPKYYVRAIAKEFDKFMITDKRDKYLDYSPELERADSQFEKVVNFFTETFKDNFPKSFLNYYLNLLNEEMSRKYSKNSIPKYEDLKAEDFSLMRRILFTRYWLDPRYEHEIEFQIFRAYSVDNYDLQKLQNALKNPGPMPPSLDITAIVSSLLSGREWNAKVFESKFPNSFQVGRHPHFINIDLSFTLKVQVARELVNSYAKILREKITRYGNLSKLEEKELPDNQVPTILLPYNQVPAMLEYLRRFDPIVPTIMTANINTFLKRLDPDIDNDIREFYFMNEKQLVSRISYLQDEFGIIILRKNVLPDILLLKNISNLLKTYVKGLKTDYDDTLGKEVEKVARYLRNLYLSLRVNKCEKSSELIIPVLRRYLFTVLLRKEFEYCTENQYRILKNLLKEKDPDFKVLENIVKMDMCPKFTKDDHPMKAQYISDKGLVKLHAFNATTSDLLIKYQTAAKFIRAFIDKLSLERGNLYWSLKFDMALIAFAILKHGKSDHECDEFLDSLLYVFSDNRDALEMVQALKKYILCYNKLPSDKKSVIIFSEWLKNLVNQTKPEYKKRNLISFLNEKCKDLSKIIKTEEKKERNQIILDQESERKEKAKKNYCGRISALKLKYF